jgi:hypothetical protein
MLSIAQPKKISWRCRSGFECEFETVFGGIPRSAYAFLSRGSQPTFVFWFFVVALRRGAAVASVGSTAHQFPWHQADMMTSLSDAFGGKADISQTSLNVRL